MIAIEPVHDDADATGGKRLAERRSAHPAQIGGRCVHECIDNRFTCERLFLVSTVSERWKVLFKPGACIVLAVVVMAANLGKAAGAPPCLRNAKAAAKSCRSLCRSAYKIDRAACVPREGECVASCKVHLDGCQAVGFTLQELLFCAQEFEAARVACLTQFPDDASDAFFGCVEQARREAVKCRAGVVDSAYPRSCREEFDRCRNLCPTTPSLDVTQCQVQALGNDQACLARCAADQGAAQQLCGTSVSACVSQCDDDLGSCAIFPPGTRQVVLACKVAFKTAAVACKIAGAPPSCIANAQFEFEGCVGPTEDSAAAAFIGCGTGYDQCIGACSQP